MSSPTALWHTLILCWTGCGVLNALLLGFDEFMTQWQTCERLGIPKRSMVAREILGMLCWGFIIGLLVLPVAASLFTVGRPLVRFLWTGRWR